MQALSQLSYGPVPMKTGLVSGFECAPCFSKPRRKNN
jgi:hypothetical protein